MAICKSCGQSYSRWFTPVSARGVCRACFQPQFSDEPDIEPELFGSTHVAPTPETEGTPSSGSGNFPTESTEADSSDV